jgi:hypothetical protein
MTSPELKLHCLVTVCLLLSWSVLGLVGSSSPSLIFDKSAPHISAADTWESLRIIMRWFPPAFRILCRWPEVGSSAFRGDFSPQGPEGALYLYPLIYPQKRLLALGGGGPLLPVVIRLSCIKSRVLFLWKVLQNAEADWFKAAALLFASYKQH